MNLDLIYQEPVEDTPSAETPPVTILDGGQRVPVYYGDSLMAACPEAYRTAMAALGYDFDRVQLKSSVPSDAEPRDWLEYCVCLAEAAYIHNGFRTNYNGQIGWNDMLGPDTTSSVTVQTRGMPRTIFYHKDCTPEGYPRRCNLYGWAETSGSPDFINGKADIVPFFKSLINNLNDFDPARFAGLPQIAPVPVFDSQVTEEENPNSPAPPDYPRGTPNYPPSQYYWNNTFKEWRPNFMSGSNGYSDAWMTGTYPYAV